MTLHVVALGGPTVQVKLKDNAIAVPALASQVRPALVVAERETAIYRVEREHSIASRAGSLRARQEADCARRVIRLASRIALGIRRTSCTAARSLNRM